MTDYTNLRINCLGASNTEISKKPDLTTDYTYNYPTALSGILGCKEVRNYGVSGSNISKSQNRGDSYCERAAFMNKAADYIFVQGGGNDASHNIPLGEADDTNIGTYYGAIEYLINSLKHDYPNAKIIFLSAMKKKKKLVRRNDTLTHADFARALDYVCEKHGIRVFDFYNDETLDAENPDIMPDGVHLSHSGCDYYARRVADIIKGDTEND